MTTRLQRIEDHLAEAKADGENGECLFPWQWIQQLVDLVHAAEPFAVLDHCPRNRGLSGACVHEPDLDRDEWCSACTLADALVALAWAADDVEVPS